MIEDTHPGFQPFGFAGSMALDDMDRQIIETALQCQHYDVSATTPSLGTTRETLHCRISEYEPENHLARGRE